MFQLTSLTPFKGLDHHTVEIKAFPFSIGRHDSADFYMEGAGIWENHALISLNEDGRPVLSICKQASCLLNDEVIQGVHVLKSGDILKIDTSVQPANVVISVMEISDELRGV